MRPIEYWNATAASIEAEDRKARIYASSHRQILGIAREAILRTEIRRETPHPYAVTTGIVCDDQDEQRCSGQLDILVYDPQQSPILYDVEDFTVVSNKSARCGIEVKSDLNGTEFGKAIDISRSLRSLSVECLAFGFTGLTCNTFVKRLCELVSDEFFSLPMLVAVPKEGRTSWGTSLLAAAIVAFQTLLTLWLSGRVEKKRLARNQADRLRKDGGGRQDFHLSQPDQRLSIVQATGPGHVS